jgi:hypothetical protein
MIFSNLHRDMGEVVRSVMELQEVLSDRANRFRIYADAARTEQCAHVAAYHHKAFSSGYFALNGVRRSFRTLGLLT